MSLLTALASSTGEPRRPPATNQSLVESLDCTWPEYIVSGSTPITIAPCSCLPIAVAWAMFLPKRWLGAENTPSSFGP
ncbi:MAG: hypothetical protein BGN99_32615 [Alphaproteobacteria bacterium 65-37]|nr:MAG: hypothetical protein BGN99_32615 [Alphaproteobacteria bacterium 65-37]